MSVLTSSDLWATVRSVGKQEPTELACLQVLKRGILRLKYASISWDRVLSLERVVDRVLNGKIADVDEETVNEARRIGLRISALSLWSRHELGEYGLAFVELGTGVPKNTRKLAAGAEAGVME